MERLTKPTNNGGHEWSLLGKNSNLKTIKRRLGKYEDTGLTPDEVIAIQKENAELKELLKLAINELKRCADDNGGCYGCKNLDLDKDECICICEEGKLLCNSVDNNMWQWQHADKLKELGVEV